MIITHFMISSQRTYAGLYFLKWSIKLEKFLCPCKHRSPPVFNGIDNIRRRSRNEEEEEESELPLEAVVIPRDSEGSFPSQSTCLMIVYTLESVLKSLLSLCFSLSQHEYQCHHERGCSS